MIELDDIEIQQQEDRNAIKCLKSCFNKKRILNGILAISFFLSVACVIYLNNKEIYKFLVFLNRVFR